MSRESQLLTYEHAGHVIYVHTYRAITRGWTVHVAVVGEGTGGRTESRHVAWNAELICTTSAEAAAAGKEMARAFIDGMLAAA
jgi:hypothetical protein